MKRLAGVFLCVPLLAACNQAVSPPGPSVTLDASIDSLAFWPPTLRYARAGDTVAIRMRGLQLGYTCATLGEIRWFWNDSLGSDFYTLHTEVDVPGGNACGRGGTFDSTFRVVFYSPAGEKLFVRSNDTVRMDSLLYLSGFGYTETFAHGDSDPDTAVIERGAYRFVYHDSTAQGKRRFITATLPICETFQSALFTRDGDSIRVRLRRIVASPLPAAQFPPCAGEHPDTMDVVHDLYAPL